MGKRFVIYFLALPFFCYPQKKEAVFKIAKPKYENIYDFKMFEGYDTLITNRIYKFDMSEALGKFDYIDFDRLPYKLEGKILTFTTPIYRTGTEITIRLTVRKKGKDVSIFRHAFYLKLLEPE